MRLIEMNMLEAIRAGRNWRSGNTSVEWTITRATTVSVRLHGHLIAEQVGAGPWRLTWAGWPTATTRSRLRALAWGLGLPVSPSLDHGEPSTGAGAWPGGSRGWLGAWPEPERVASFDGWWRAIGRGGAR